MPKTCTYGNCNNPAWSKGRCKYHPMKRKRIETKKPIKAISSKQVKLLAEYRKVRDPYMRNHPKCEVDGCQNKSTELHHKKGRGEFLSDVRYFMAVCRGCHKKITENPTWAYENGYSVRRLEK
jgi:hypothetical protein